MVPCCLKPLVAAQRVVLVVLLLAELQVVLVLQEQQVLRVQLVPVLLLLCLW